MAETQLQTQLEGVTLEGDELTSLLQKEFKPKTDEAKSARNRLRALGSDAR